MEPTLIQNKTIEFEIPLDDRPRIDGIGEMVDETQYTFTNVGLQPLSIRDMDGTTESTGYLVVAYIKVGGCILASIPFFFRWTTITEASFSIFKFKAGEQQTKFKIWLTKLIKTF